MNCTSSTFHLLSEYAGLDLGDFVAAKTAKTFLEKGKTRRLPQAVVDYD